MLLVFHVPLSCINLQRLASLMFLRLFIVVLWLNFIINKVWYFKVFVQLNVNICFMNMYFKVIRKTCNKSCIRGTLCLCDGPFILFPICETLEPSPNCLLFSNEDGQKCYPAVEEGGYDLSITFSPKFKCNLPLIDVPKRQGIRIHAGNNSFDTSGCVLVGVYGDLNSISHSRVALKYVLDVIKVTGVTKIIFENSPKLF